jgi:hypothetical protein
MLVLAHGRYGLRECQNIYGALFAVELHTLAVNLLASFSLTQYLPQPEEGQAQIVTGFLVIHVRPQQGSQAVAAVGAVGFNGQIDEQCANFVAAKTGKGTAVVQNLKGS